jgi:putative membrane protein
MNALPKDRVQQCLIAGLLVAVFASCISPPYSDYLLMQHVPTLIAVGALVAVTRRFEISRFSFASIVFFLALHTLGARYLYSYVPYDDWSRALIGTGISEQFGWERNHYDRLVHFSFGLLLAVPIQEFERRHLNLSVRASSILAIECILAMSAAYELLEWLVAVVFTPEWADQFLGLQGDIFDAQKDTTLATAGAVISICALGASGRFRTGNARN